MKKLLTILIAVLLFMAGYSQPEIEIAAGTTLRTAGGVKINITNLNLVNHGTLQQVAADGTFIFSGGQINSISGNSLITFDKLTIQKSDGIRLNLERNVNVLTELNFLSGFLDLTNFSVNLGTTGVLINESSSSRSITTGVGYIEAVRTLNAPAAINAGNLGAIITSSANLGITTVRRYNQVQSNGTNESIRRYYHIRPAVNTNLNATLRILYFDTQLNGISESTMTVWGSTGSGWSDLGFSSRNTSLNYVERNALGSLSMFTLMPPAGALRMQNSTRLAESSRIKLSPNPVRDVAILTMSSLSDQEITVAIYDNRGALVRSYRQPTIKGAMMLRINMQDLPQGIYTLKVSGKELFQSMKLMKN